MKKSMKWKLLSFLLVITPTLTHYCSATQDQLYCPKENGNEEECNSSFASSHSSKPVYHDLWGYPVNWTDPGDGWDDEMRKSMIDLTNHILQQREATPTYTKIGYQKMKIPLDLYEHLLEQRQTSQLKMEQCRHSPYINCISIDKNGRKIHKRNVQVMSVKNEKKVRTKIIDTLKPMLEEWSGIRLSKQVVIYGIRRYLRGSWLSLHVDQVQTHLLSVILQAKMACMGDSNGLDVVDLYLCFERVKHEGNGKRQIDQKVDEEWPLTVIDHEDQRGKVFLKPGEMLFYEGAKMPHGRQFPLNGDFFDNLFVHFHPQ